MNWFSLLKRLLQGKGKELTKTLVYETIHAALINAPSGIIVWIAWTLLNSTSTISDQKTTLTTALIIMLVTFLCQLALAPMLLGAASKFSFNLGCLLRIRLGNHLRQLSCGTFFRQNRQLVADQLIQAIDRFEFVLSHSLANISAAFFTPILLGALLFWLQWQLAIALYIALVIAILCQWLVGTIISHYQQSVTTSEQQLRGRILEYLQGIDILKNYGFENLWKQQLDGQIEQAHNYSLRQQLLPVPTQLTPTLILELGFLSMLAIGNYLLLHGSIDSAAFLAILLIGYRVYEPIKILFADYVLLRQSDDQLQILHDLMNTKVMTQKEPVQAPRGFDIKFHQLSFAYEQQPIIHQFNLDVPTGNFFALVGASGAGKTTLLNLLLRLWDPQEGSISIGGADLRHMDFDKHQSLLAMAFQETWLFNDTIKNNIAFGNPNANDAQLQQVLQDSGCLTIAERIGFNTHIGENGIKLSGGQKQLVAIARAMLKNAPIILFDEASASLDPENEHLIQQSIARLSAGKTLIVIAHTLHTIENADQIIVIENGRVEEQGTHHQLLDHQGSYHRMWHKQHHARGWQIHRKAVHL